MFQSFSEYLNIWNYDILLHKNKRKPHCCRVLYYHDTCSRNRYLRGNKVKFPMTSQCQTNQNNHQRHCFICYYCSNSAPGFTYSWIYFYSLKLTDQDYSITELGVKSKLINAIQRHGRKIYEISHSCNPENQPALNQEIAWSKTPSRLYNSYLIIEIITLESLIIKRFNKLFEAI